MLSRCGHKEAIQEIEVAHIPDSGPWAEDVNPAKGLEGELPSLGDRLPIRLVTFMVDGRDRAGVRELGDECLGLITQCHICEDDRAAGIEELLSKCQVDP